MTCREPRPPSARTRGLVRAALAGIALTTCAAQPGTAPAKTAHSANKPDDTAFVADTRRYLDELVAVDTSHGHETDALRPIADRFRAAGLPLELVESAPGRGNLVARYKGTGKKRPLLLIAHVDVVPVEGQ